MFGNRKHVINYIGFVGTEVRIKPVQPLQWWNRLIPESNHGWLCRAIGSLSSTREGFSSVEKWQKVQLHKYSKIKHSIKASIIHLVPQLKLFGAWFYLTTRKTCKFNGECWTRNTIYHTPISSISIWYVHWLVLWACMRSYHRDQYDMIMRHPWIANRVITPYFTQKSTSFPKITSEAFF